LLVALKEKEPVKIISPGDDKDDQEIFMEAVNEANVPSDIITAGNGGEFIITLKDESEPKPDITLIDINMPIKGS